MCELCTAKTTYLGSPIPGWHLSRATRNGDFMKKGQYGLTMSNDPAYVWDDKPVPEPALSKSGGRKPFDKRTKPEQTAITGWRKAAYRVLEAFSEGHPSYAWRLIEAARKVGFTPDLGHFEFWLFEHLGRHLARYAKKHPKVKV